MPPAYLLHSKKGIKLKFAKMWYGHEKKNQSGMVKQRRVQSKQKSELANVHNTAAIANNENKMLSVILHNIRSILTLYNQ